MGERLRRQENMRVLARLSLENIRRAFFTALVCCGLLPVMLVINVFSFDDNPVASVITALLIVFEILTIAFTVFSFMAMKSSCSSCFHLYLYMPTSSPAVVLHSTV